MEMMHTTRRASWTRKAFLRLGVALPAPLLLAACGGQTGAGTAAGSRRAGAPSNEASGSQAAPPPTGNQVAAPAGAAGSPPQLAPTPACVDADDVTPPQTAGPYFKANSPQRTSLLEPGTSGTRLLLTGRVLGTNCQPIARALIDFWQADDRGNYDNTGYRFRGHQFADGNGQYRLETIMPGLYPGRTRHLHVRVQAPNRPVLTTQLYFPNEPANARDSIFHRELVLEMQRASDGFTGRFDFVLHVA
jgi:protocatechuate 3,4-dioxygenase beta subunit